MSEAKISPQPRRPAAKAPARRPEARPGSGERRPLARAMGRIPVPHFKRPSKKALYWSGGVAALVVIAIAILIVIWDWNWFRGPVARIASAQMHREVQINGDLDVHPFSWQPRATVEGIRIANPDWADKTKPMAEIERIAIQIRLLPLFKGQVDLRLLQFDRPRLDLRRDAQGRTTWDFSGGVKRAEPLKLPPIRSFIINDGHVRYLDEQRKVDFTGEINARERLGEAGRGFELTGKGSYNTAPFTMEVTGGPLLNIERDKPYPFDAEMRAGNTVITAKGAVPKPFDMAQFGMAATARGPDLGELYRLTGVALPNTPPYNLRGRVSRDGNLWKVEGLGGKVGSSDLAGDLSVETGRDRPLLKGHLVSQSLDFLDLGALFGGAPKAGAAASPNQIAAAKQLQGQGRIMPDATLDVSRIRAVDADVTYRAVAIRNTPMDLKSGSVHVKLNDGLLRAEDLAFVLPQGSINGEVQLDARKEMPVTRMDLRLANARLEHLLPFQFQGSTPFAGPVVGRARLTGTGNSVHKAFASADGQVAVVTSGGEIRQSLAELAGVNVTKGLGLLLSGSEKKTELRCGVAHFTARNGTFQANRIVMDTGPVRIDGSGSVNMATERMNLRLQGHPKKLRLVRVALPVTVKGSLGAPNLGVDPTKAIAQGGVAAALGTVLTPLAAILPFIDPGLAKDANCQGIVAESIQAGAPVTSRMKAATRVAKAD